MERHYAALRVRLCGSAAGLPEADEAGIETGIIPHHPHPLHNLHAHFS